MKLKAYIIQTMCIAVAILAISGCAKDNYTAPQSILSGHVVYNGTAVGVRSNGNTSGGAQLEIWQHGYQLFTKIPVYIAQDGSYSALLFDGDYLIDRLAGAPWVPQPTDSVLVHVRGNTTQDITVTPYFFVSAVTYTHTANTVTATITIVKPTGSTGTLSAVRLYVGRTIITDQTSSDAVISIPAASIVVGTPFTATVTIPATLLPGGLYASQAAGGIYARVGVLSTQASELQYSTATFIPLP